MTKERRIRILHYELSSASHQPTQKISVHKCVVIVAPRPCAYMVSALWAWWIGSPLDAGPCPLLASPLQFSNPGYTTGHAELEVFSLKVKKPEPALIA